MQNVRKPSVAGIFYPNEPARLRALLEYLLAAATPPTIPGKLRALIVPHAGYAYSGPVAATGYKLLQTTVKKTSPTVLLLGPAHYVYFQGAATLNVEGWQTPLGTVRAQQELIARALKREQLRDNSAAHAPEHSLEVQLPFLQFIFCDIAIFPILTGECDHRVLAQILSQYLNEIDLVLISSDLSHYYPQEEAISRDALTHEAIQNLDLVLMEKRVEACGKSAILTLLHLAREQNWSAKLLDYRNSGDTAGDKNHVVGYGCYAFYEE